MTAYYNEIDPFAAQWLRNLIAAGHIAPGDVDERSIVDVRADDLRGYAQCHFFAGIGGWSLALRLANWPDDRPVWTGSCPCQPFSAAGKGIGFDDARHLWPTWFNLIGECRPGVVFGEQVASKDGLMWLDLVHSDMEAAGYAFAALDMCSAGFGAPHIRQRLGFVAQSDEGQRGSWRAGTEPARRPLPEPAGSSSVGELANTEHGGLETRQSVGRRSGSTLSPSVVGGLADTDANRCGSSSESGLHDTEHYVEPCGRVGGLADTGDGQFSQQGWRPEIGNGHGSDRPNDTGSAQRPGPTDGPWGNPDWLLCRDGKWRPVESGTFPLAHGVSGRVGRLRAFGNSINPHQFEALIGAYLDTERVRLMSGMASDREDVFA